MRGKVGDKAVVVLEHVTRVHDDIGPDWPQPAGHGCYRVEIKGEPTYLVDVTQDSAFGDHNDASIASGVGRMVNAIPSVVAGEPRILTLLDLPLNIAKGVFATTLAKDGNN